MSFLQTNIFSSQRVPVGLDLSDLSLKLVWISHGSKWDRIRSFSSIALAPGVIVDGEIVQEEKVVEAIRKLFAQSGPEKITSRQVFCSLPEMKVFLRVIMLPRIEKEELAEAVKWEVEGNIPLSLDQIYYDYHILDDELAFLGNEKQQSVLVVAVARTIVDQYVRVIEKAGLEVVGLETESLAQARIFAPPPSDPPTTTLIVDLGDRRTSFLISVGNVPLFTSSSHLSAQMFTDILSKTLRVSFDEAEWLKRQYGIENKSNDNPLQGLLDRALNDVVSEIERAMDFYNGSLNYTPSIDRILLCGGGSNLLGLVPYLAQRLQRSVEKGDPWVTLRLGHKIPSIPFEESSQFSTALGLSLGGINSSIYASTN
ncbi:MAG: type IV pilus assembly protein PilM [Candidatus Moraniibacteriota bacterium]